MAFETNMCQYDPTLNLHKSFSVLFLSTTPAFVLIPKIMAPGLTSALLENSTLISQGAEAASFPDVYSDAAD